jgi:hypothetical protein
MRKNSLLVSSVIFTWILSGVLCQYCVAGPGTTDPQDASDSSPSLPDAPSALPAQPNQSAQLASGNDVVQEGMQTKRILGIVPNFEAVSVNVNLPRQSAKEKFMGATDDSFDYSSFVFVGGLAGVGQASNSIPEFHQGAAGYARYYWHTFADQTDENYLVEFKLRGPSACRCFCDGTCRV